MAKEKKDLVDIFESMSAIGLPTEEAVLVEEVRMEEILVDQPEIIGSGVNHGCRKLPMSDDFQKDFFA